MINIDLNLEDTYEINVLSNDLSKFSFNSPTNGASEYEEIQVEIERTRNSFLNEFLNLAFGPLDENGVINDFASVKHKDVSKALSTVLFCGLSYLETFKNVYIGID